MSLLQKMFKAREGLGKTRTRAPSGECIYYPTATTTNAILSFISSSQYYQEQSDLSVRSIYVVPLRGPLDYICPNECRGDEDDDRDDFEDKERLPKRRKLKGCAR